MAKATRGSDAQFTYDFGIAIAQSTVNQVTRLAGVTLSLASAFYALKSTATEYVNTLRENTFRFGGILSTMKAMEQAQDRLIKGQSLFSVDDQLRGMNQLMASGINVKKNLDWISKAAHASGQSLSQFSGAISNAIAGNMGQLVDMGLLTQRATRMFDKYAANTVMRQQAILNFVKNHKGLMAAIRNDFFTIQDQMLRIKETWKAFLQSILGKPNDPSSFYGQITQSMKLVADALARNLEQIKRVGYVIGSVLGWVMKQIGHFVVWIGKQMKQSLSAVWRMTDNYAEFTRSLIVWLEFWKLKIIDFFKEYGGAIKTVLKLVIAYKALKWAFLIGGPIIKSVWTFAKAIKHCYQLQMAYMAFQGPYISKTAKWFQSLAAWMPQPFRQAWVASGKYLGLMGSGCIGWGNRIGAIFKNLGIWMIAPFKSLASLVPGLLKTALGGLGVIELSPFAMFAKGAKGIHFKKLFLSYKALMISGMKDLWVAVMAVVQPIITVFKSLFGPLFKFLTSGLKNIGNLILNLPRLVGIAFRAIKGLWAALNATNPVGWIILAVTAVVLLYNKCTTFRILVNNMFKAWWEWLKLLWNLVYGAFIAIAVGCKKTWQFLNNYIFQPVANFFRKAWGWIKQMWNAFKDSSVGRFIDKWIVSPLKSLFEWIMKALRWVLKGAAAILSVINKSLADQIRKGEKELGMNTSLAASGGDYNYNDDTNYMDPSNWSLGDKNTPTEPPEVPMPTNPISDVTASVGGVGGGGTTVNNNMDFGTGAIQIIVQKGEQIDENKLARLVRDTIKDVNREQNMRGGTV